MRSQPGLRETHKITFRISRGSVACTRSCQSHVQDRGGWPIVESPLSCSGIELIAARIVDDWASPSTAAGIALGTAAGATPGTAGTAVLDAESWGALCAYGGEICCHAGGWFCAPADTFEVFGSCSIPAYSWRS